MQAYYYPPAATLSGTANGAPIPTSSILVAGENPSGNQEPLQTDAAGHLLVTQTPGVLFETDISEYGGVATSLGQKVSASSIPVVLASDEVVPISATALPLPAGAATSANQTSEITQLTAINTNTTGVSTAANQTTEITHLTSIDTKTPALGQALAAASVPVVLTAAQLATLTPLTTVSVTQGTTPWADNISQFGGSAVSLGSKVSASSIPVVIASDQGALPLPTGAATSANQATEISSLATIATNTTGAATSANQTNGTQKSQAFTPTALTIHQAAVTVGTTAVRLTVAGTAPSSTRVVLVATPDAASTATFYIGSSTVTNSGATRGVEIVAGQTFIANSDAGDYWIVSSVASQTVTIMEQF